MNQLEKSSYPSAVLLFGIFLASEVFAVNGSIVSQSNIRYFLYQSAEYPRDCQEAINQCSSNNVKSGVYLIKPDQYPEPFEVFCDNKETSRGWTVIQQRIDGLIGYGRGWDDYKQGFGFLGSEFWIGNEKLAHLTNQKRYKLRINMENSEGQSYQVTYDDFRITDEWGNYSLFSVGVHDASSEFNITWCVTNKQNGSICERSCENPDNCVPSNPLEEERCVCQENYMIHEGSCIPKEQCGCYVPASDEILMNDTSLINSACTWRVTCSNNNLINKTFSCSNDATCNESNGFGNCTCNQFYEGDGVTCNLHPCYDEGKARVLEEGESYINADCSSRITCTNKSLRRDNYGCSNDATCDETNGVGVCNCNEWFEGNGLLCERIGPQDCSDLHRAGERRDTVYTIYLPGSSGVEVYCDMSGGGWTIVQKRTSGSENFYRNWSEYKNGFGSLRSDHWLGNDKIHVLTYQKTYQLRIEKTTGAGSSYHTRYSSFRISDESQRYQLFLSGYSGNSGNNAMGANSGQRFSTYDMDFGGSSTFDCAEKHRGGWWYPDHNSTGTTEHCYTFSNRVSTGRYEILYSDCGCYYYCSYGPCSSCSNCHDDSSGFYSSSCHGSNCDSCCGTCNNRPHRKCIDCDGCSGNYDYRCCRNKNRVEIYETNYYSCGYSNLNGDYQYQDYRGIFWKNLRESDCGITTTIMKIRPA